MDFSIKALDPKTAPGALRSGCLVIGVFENRKLAAPLQELAKNAAIAAALKSGDLSGKTGSTLLLRGVDGIAAERVLLVGLGKADAFNDKNFTAAANAALRVLATLGGAEAALA
ncbi:MAG: M17 family peptidase N-terminal domain-containing protein, partial [Burkholderiaceae bacterium]